MKYKCCFPSESTQKRFEKNLSQIPHDNLQDEIMEAIAKLEENPRPFGAKPFKQLNPPIQCYNFTAHYRIRVRDYRVLYDITDEKKIIWIIALKKRDERTYRSS